MTFVIPQATANPAIVIAPDLMGDESGTTGAIRSFVDCLIANGRLTSLAAERLCRVVADTGEPLVGAIVKLGLLTDVAVAEEQAAHLALTRFNALEPAPTPIELAGVNESFLREHEVVPLSFHDGELVLATWNAIDDFPARALAFACECRVIPRIATRAEIESWLAALYPVSAETTGRNDGTSDVQDDELDRLKDLASDAPVIRLVQRVINEAVSRKASDIHLEAIENALRIRFRIDGMLQDFERHPAALKRAVISRLKIMATLDIAERRLPQDGRIRVTVQGKEIDFRVATTPTLHGESVVLRILDRQEVELDFAALGFEADLTATLRTALAKPHGIVLVTGPTGSGKTTTLYAALKELHTPEKKILTIEDPVEYTLEGVNQLHVRPQIGLTFASALRAFLRQDPDIMMVGEIRDRETAEIAIQAALTGHLLLSTLHTNSAAGGITRLLDMGIDDFLLTSTANLIVGQRLVRKLCAQCRERMPITPEVAQHFEIPRDVAFCYQARGCSRCTGTGYRGRTSIVELLELTEPIRKLVLEHADATRLEQVAVEGGMRTMTRHGVEKAIAGVTSLEEVLRVVRSA